MCELNYSAADIFLLYFVFRYTQETDKSFSFFMNEDCFIINILNELIRALQTEMNTQVSNLGCFKSSFNIF